MKRLLIAASLTIAALFLGVWHMVAISAADVTTVEAGQQYPKCCCTDAGKLGPYENDSVKEGKPCYGTDRNGRRHEGTACHCDSAQSSNRSSRRSVYPKYCCTDAGKLGPYENNSVKKGEACYGTDRNGRRHEGKACF